MIMDETIICGKRQDGAAMSVLLLVARARGISVPELLQPTRRRAPVAAARQLAMYLCHVMLGRSLTEVGRFFGRDRTTVAHACALVEDSRDDARIDADIQRLEDRIAAGARQP